MKKLLLIALLIGMMGGCRNKTKVDEQKEREICELSNGYIFEVVVYDSCEYLINLSRGNTVHKGNCKNPIHKGGNK